MTAKGKVIGAIAWVVFIIFGATQMACLKNNSCDVIDMAMFGIISIGMAAPAWFVGTVFGGKDNK